MRLGFHPQIASDISRIMDYYEEASGHQLADEFYSDLRSCFQKAANSPEAYDIRERDLRRVNLERFPYHFLFRIVDDQVRILVIRHHRRRPSLGLHRR
jgi:plasmid stabilization system protein ParE